MRYFIASLLSVVVLVSVIFLFNKEKATLPVILVDWSPELIDKDKKIIPFEDRASKLIGYKNEKGEVIISPQFNSAQDFNKYGVADVFIEGKNQSGHWYKINLKGEKIVTSFFFDNGPDYYVLGLARYVEKGKVGFIDPKATIVLKAEYDWARSFSFNAPITYVCQGCYEAPIFDAQGRKSEYAEIQGGKWGAIDKTGKIIVPLDYDSVHSSYKDTLQFKKENKCLNLYWDGKETFKLSEHKCF